MFARRLSRLRSPIFAATATGLKRSRGVTWCNVGETTGVTLLPEFGLKVVKVLVNYFIMVMD